MGGHLVGLMLLLAAVFGMYSWLRGDRSIFEDEIVFGSVLMLVGVIGGALLGLAASQLLSDTSLLPDGVYPRLFVAFAVWVGWGIAVFRFLSANSGPKKPGGTRQ